LEKRPTARAIESQSYVIAAAQYGKHNNKRESYGHSLAVDPWGKIVADAGGCGRDDGRPVPQGDDITTPAIVVCEIDLDLLASVRQRMPLQLHRENAEFSVE
jgi:deaminated glutathione amidase